MENNDLDSKKTNNKQQINDQMVSEKTLNETNTVAPKLKEEIEIDGNGNEKVVLRARNVDGSIAAIPETEDRTWNENESLSRGVSTEKEAMKTVENEDLNSDITAHRYPASNPDNKEDRGNIKLDE
ncbi:hypothetical protein SAMN04488062_102173 [Flavobacterium omnivorum]|uniref:Uncharacterized protein n=1 Tax=Flavobacterium omnivorum TaxID=178355 RepID=A0A1G7X503_9FLAO|nr:hypothetical protein [Flavobacterium omnivorum]SDG79284.1 hypothetical protein SAMN04488062_102173 [Flavobacterium omnivorum]